MVRIAWTEAPSKVPVIRAVVVLETFKVAILNIALVSPPATVTDSGVFAETSLLLRRILDPSGGAGSLRTMVPTEP
jgi:hypothetical protein